MKTYTWHLALFALMAFLMATLHLGCDTMDAESEQQMTFALTSNTYAWDTPDFDAVCQQTFGAAYRLADWHDILAFTEVHGTEAFFASAGLITYRSNAWVTNNHVHLWSPGRHFFVERHDGQVSSGWLVHATLEANTLNLGSWYNDRPALCFTSI